MNKDKFKLEVIPDNCLLFQNAENHHIKFEK